MKRRILYLLVFIGLSAGCWTASAEQPSSRGPTIAVGETRAQIQATPVLERPYRPLHFYGNTVRRRHYRGTATPAPRGIVQGNSADSGSD
jgi:hypothetical protein